MMLKFPYTTNVRRYKKDGSFLWDAPMPYLDPVRAVRDAQGITAATEKVDKFLVALDIAPVLPTNISVRGPNGRFIKWKK